MKTIFKKTNKGLKDLEELERIERKSKGRILKMKTLKKLYGKSDLS